jgi:EAL domain-containing protein (putative c-di-GMP-specific phosphodiesterase class I)
VDDVLNIVSNSKINPLLLKLELTESSLLKNVDQSIEKMQQLQNSGIGFSMDDFGIGYSSLSYLKRLPLDQLKIDQSFVRDIAIDPNDAIIARTIIAMAQNMNLQVIAEGVETEAQKNFLEQNGCSTFQGYFFGRPVPVKEFEQQLIDRNYC